MLYHMSETALAIIARRMSRKIVIRSYINGCSADRRRECTNDEQVKLYRVLYAALLSINYCARENADMRKAIMNSAEFTLHQFIPDANTYDSVYNRIRCLLDVWDNSADGPALAHWHYTGIRNLFPEELDYLDDWLTYPNTEITPMEDLEDARSQIDGMMTDADDMLPETLQNPDIMMLLWNTYVRTPGNVQAPV